MDSSKNLYKKIIINNLTRHTITLTIHTIAPTRHTIAFDTFALKMQKSPDGERSTEAFEFYSDKAIVCL